MIDDIAPFAPFVAIAAGIGATHLERRLDEKHDIFGTMELLLIADHIFKNPTSRELQHYVDDSAIIRAKRLMMQYRVNGFDVKNDPAARSDKALCDVAYKPHVSFVTQNGRSS